MANRLIRWDRNCVEGAEKVRIGIVGAGFSALLHTHAVKKEYPETEIIVFDINPQTARAFSEQCGISVAETVEALYEQADAVIICTPTFTHYDLVMEAMERKKHILCEKPMALNAEDAKKMADRAKEVGTVCAVGFNYRFFDITETWKKQYAQEGVHHIKLVIQKKLKLLLFI